MGFWPKSQKQKEEEEKKKKQEQEAEEAKKQDERERLVATAVRFLQNPRVKDATTTQKKTFLRSKGLSDDDIKTAFERYEEELKEQKEEKAKQSSAQAATPQGDKSAAPTARPEDTQAIENLKQQNDKLKKELDEIKSMMQQLLKQQQPQQPAQDKKNDKESI